jgi:hypothetical protein
MAVFCKNSKQCCTGISLRNGKERCFHCEKIFEKYGEKEIKEFQNSECGFCSEIKTCFDHYTCEHKICRKCFRCVYFKYIHSDDYDIEDIIGEEPDHPYTHICDFDPVDDFSDINDYPLIVQYNIEFAIWKDKFDKLERELCSQKCKICSI